MFKRLPKKDVAVKEDDVIYMVDENLFGSTSVLTAIVKTKHDAFSNIATLHEIVDKYPQDKEIKIVLNTAGGELTACEKIMKKLQKHPAGYVVYIRNECFSAGTLIALGAREIIMTDDSYLGKVDPQQGSKQLIIYTTIPEKYISSHNIYDITNAKYVLNYLEKLLKLIIPDDEHRALINKHMVYSELPHETTFDKHDCSDILKLKVRGPTATEMAYFDSKIKVKNYKRI